MHYLSNDEKKCNRCGIVKPLTDFYISIRKDRPTGKNHKISHTCKNCTNQQSRERYASGLRYEKTRKAYSNSEKGKKLTSQASKRHYESIRGRSCHLLNNAKKRQSKWTSFDIDREFIEQKLKNGVCEITGIPFDFTSPGESKKNPFAPSLDRIDNKVGYIKTNVRVVLWAVNLMHGEMTDDQLVVMCKAVIEGLKK